MSLLASCRCSVDLQSLDSTQWCRPLDGKKLCTAVAWQQNSKDEKLNTPAVTQGPYSRELSGVTSPAWFFQLVGFEVSLMSRPKPWHRPPPSQNLLSRPAARTPNLGQEVRGELLLARQTRRSVIANKPAALSVSYTLVLQSWSRLPAM